MKVYYIAGYKNARDCKKFADGHRADDYYENTDVANGLTRFLKDRGIPEEQIISVNIVPTTTRDTGSWEIFITVRDKPTVDMSSCIDRTRLENWTDHDFQTHTVAVRHTIKTLLDALGL